LIVNYILVTHIADDIVIISILTISTILIIIYSY